VTTVEEKAEEMNSCYIWGQVQYICKPEGENCSFNVA